MVHCAVLPHPVSPRSLGQNFCTDDRILCNIVAAARVAPGDPVIEVGPGTGNLTRHLLATKAHVLAVEKDDTLIERLRDELKQVKYQQRRLPCSRDPSTTIPVAVGWQGSHRRP